MFPSQHNKVRPRLAAGAASCPEIAYRHTHQNSQSLAKVSGSTVVLSPFAEALQV